MSLIVKKKEISETNNTPNKLSQNEKQINTHWMHEPYLQKLRKTAKYN